MSSVNIRYSETAGTLENIGVSLAIGFVIGTASFLAFARGLKKQSPIIAPKCTARPKETIYNPDATGDHDQNRGNPYLLGWMFWIMNLSFEDLLQGVPGTGTREKGVAGRKLYLNLDEIVMLRMQHTGFKVASLTTLIAITIVLPLNVTAPCFNPLDTTRDCVNSTDISNITNYQRTTIANIPPVVNNANFIPTWGHLEQIPWSGEEFSDILVRLYIIAMCSWVVHYYVTRELYQEWQTMLALRRVYYLEYDVWRRRRQELLGTINKLPSFMLKSKKSHNSVSSRKLSESWTQSGMKSPFQHRRIRRSHLRQRFKALDDPWILDPEVRDNLPNIELYSVLVCNVPSKPTDIIRESHENASMIESENTLWQLKVVSSFFNQCIPTQQGFSSSIAAISVLPCTQVVASCWSDWYAAAAAMRKYNFIMQLMNSIGDDSPETVLPFQDAIEAEMEIFETKCYGPEQSAEYDRIQSEAATAPFPRGLGEYWLIWKSNIEVLTKEKLKAEQRLLDAKTRLQESRMNVYSSMGGHLTPKKEEDMMERGHVPRVQSAEILFDNDTMLVLNSKVATRDSDEVWKSAKLKLRKHRFAHHINTHLAESEDKGTMRVKRLEEDVLGGQWNIDIIKAQVLRAIICLKNSPRITYGWSKEKVDALKENDKASTFAVVTFISRRAALAARHCLLDGKGEKAWIDFKDLPVPPLASAAPFKPQAFCKPVSFAIGTNHMLVRKITAYLILALMYIFSTFFFTWLSDMLNSDAMLSVDITPEIAPMLFDDAQDFTSIFDGFIPGFVQAVYLSIVPQVIRFISNCGSGSKSLAAADACALKYYWWFIYIISFTGPLIATMVINVSKNGNASNYYTMFLEELANTLPTQTSFIWLNVMITRFAISLPAINLLNIVAYVFQFFKLRWFKLLATGGMNGLDMPYYIHVDSGAAFLCCTTLSFVSPLVAPATLAYFFFAVPIRRWNALFVYRQKYDGGGFRWPFVFDMYITSLILGQILLSLTLLLKQAPGPALFGIAPLFPTLLFRHRCHSNFKKAFEDCGLLQISRQDGWNKEISKKEREEYRKFLVDAHKAAYLPMCIAAESLNGLTLEVSSVVCSSYDKDTDDKCNQKENENYVEHKRARFAK